MAYVFAAARRAGNFPTSDSQQIVHSQGDLFIPDGFGGLGTNFFPQAHALERTLRKDRDCSLQLFIVLLDKVFEMRLMSIGFSFWMDGFCLRRFSFLYVVWILSEKYLIS